MSLGKHVYVQKPLCWSVHEARHLAKKAIDTKVVDADGQPAPLGGQLAARDRVHPGRRARRVSEVHVWTNRPLGFWPQGVPRPAPLPAIRRNCAGTTAASMQRLARRDGRRSYPVPDKLSWDLFLGVAPDVEYHPLYHPFNWRGWVDWGQGALGDMGAHLMDFPVWSLESRAADGDRDRVDAVQRRLLSECDDNVLSSSRRGRACRR